MREREGEREREREKKKKIGELSSKRGQAGTGIDQTLRLGGAMENSIDWEEASLNSTDSR